MKNTNKSIDLLQKFVYIPREKDTRKGLENVQIHNGVQCATDGIRAAIILPDTVPDWDLSDAYMDCIDLVEMIEKTIKNKKVTEEKIIVEKPYKMDLSKNFNVSYQDYTIFDFQITKTEVKKLINSCKGIQSKYKQELSILTAKQKKSLPMYANIYINIETREIITREKAKELNVGFDNKVIAFNTKYLKESLEFILSSEEKEVYCYYKSCISPFIMKSGKLYIAVCPHRIV